MCKPLIICQELLLYPFSSQRNITHCVFYGNCPFHLFVENSVLYNISKVVRNRHELSPVDILKVLFSYLDEKWSILASSYYSSHSELHKLFPFTTPIEHHSICLTHEMRWLSSRGDSLGIPVPQNWGWVGPYLQVYLTLTSYNKVL